jgi:hypothetical protein
MNKKLITARREVERLRLEADGADKPAVAIWEAGNKVDDLEAAERESAVNTARRAALVMDAALLIVVLLTMGFSLQNIHDFAAQHGVQDPIAWFVAPAVDLALIAALLGDAVLSRHQLDAGKWATALRWYAGAATVVLNSWQSWAKLDAAGILLHTAMPVLLFVLAEAASPYRVKFANTVRLAAATARDGQTHPDTVVSTPQKAGADASPPAAPAPVLVQQADTVYDHASDPAVSTMTPQVAAVATPAPVKPSTKADSTGDRLSADAAKAAIEAAWEAGLTVREAAVKATRATSYVGTVYARLTKARGPQPSKGQTTIEIEVEAA